MQDHPVAPSAASSPTSTDGLVVRSVEDRRRPARGLSRLLVLAMAIMGAVITVPSAVNLIRHPAQAPVIGSLNVAAGILFILASVCVAHNGRRMRMIGWMSLTALMTGAALFGLLTFSGLAPDLQESVWFDAGRELFFLPLIMPVVASVWLWMSDPRRIVVAAEKFEDLAHSRK